MLNPALSFPGHISTVFHAHHRSPLCITDGEPINGHTPLHPPPSSSSSSSPSSSTSSSPSSSDDEELEGDPFAGAQAFLTSPLCLRRKSGRTEDRDKMKEKEKGKDEEKPSSLLSRVVDLLRSARPGSDLAKFQVPVQFNMGKSQLQVYGESVYCCKQDLVGKCAEGGTPTERFLSVVAWHLSTTRPAPFGKSPLNPILGETHHASNGDLNVFLEQVSHHPPITALYACNKAKGIQIQWWHSAEPRFNGTSVEVNMSGRRTMTLSRQGGEEKYEMKCPNLLIRLFPSPGMEWVGKTSIRCTQSNLEAIIVFKRKGLFGMGGGESQVEGKIWDTRSSSKILYQISGSWDGVTLVKDIETGKSHTLYDAEAAIADLQTPVVEDSRALLATESAVVWSEVTKGIVERDWSKAREAKKRIEDSQRGQARRETGAREWSPRWFVKMQSGDWEWKHPHNPPLSKAPILATTCP